MFWNLVIKSLFVWPEAVLEYKFMLKDIKAVVFDLDGTIYFGGRKLAPMANEVVNLARKEYNNIFFATNNSAISLNALLQRLIKLGIDVSIEEIISSGFLIKCYLKKQNFKNVYCLTTDELAEDIKTCGIITNSIQPEAIIIGYDKNFCMDKLEKALNVYNKDCKIIVANMDRTYPRENGIIAPGAGPIVSAFKYCINSIDEDIIIGKPATQMLLYVAEKLNLKPENILMVGDSIESDMKMAEDFGAKCIYIRNGNPICKKYLCINELKELLEIL